MSIYEIALLVLALIAALAFAIDILTARKVSLLLPMGVSLIAER